MSGMQPKTPKEQSMSWWKNGMPRMGPIINASGKMDKQAMIPASTLNLFFTGSIYTPIKNSEITRWEKASQSVPYKITSGVCFKHWSSCEIQFCKARGNALRFEIKKFISVRRGKAVMPLNARRTINKISILLIFCISVFISKVLCISKYSFKFF